jgi:hypothetical protein
MFAAMFDRAEVVAALLARGARADRADCDGRRAVDYAEAIGGRASGGGAPGNLGLTHLAPHPAPPLAGGGGCGATGERPR